MDESGTETSQPPTIESAEASLGAREKADWQRLNGVLQEKLVGNGPAVLKAIMEGNLNKGVWFDWPDGTKSRLVQGMQPNPNDTAAILAAHRDSDREQATRLVIGEDGPEGFITQSILEFARESKGNTYDPETATYKLNYIHPQDQQGGRKPPMATVNYPESAPLIEAALAKLGAPKPTAGTNPTAF